MGFLDDYEPVEDRIRKFWDDWPDGKLLTELVHHDPERYIVKAYAFKRTPDPIDVSTVGELSIDRTAPDATGYAHETVGSSNVNKTSALENCETSAIGRALANLGYAPKGARPSREEMSKAAPTVLEDIECPACGSGVVNNLPTHSENPKQPAFKCSNDSCGGGGKKKGGGNWPWATWDADFFRHEEPDPNDPKPVREDFPKGEFAPGEEPF